MMLVMLAGAVALLGRLMLVMLAGAVVLVLSLQAERLGRLMLVMLAGATLSIQAGSWGG